MLPQSRRHRPEGPVVCGRTLGGPREATSGLSLCCGKRGELADGTVSLRSPDRGEKIGDATQAVHRLGVNATAARKAMRQRCGDRWDVAASGLPV